MEGPADRAGAVSSPVRYCGREFSGAELKMIRTLAATLPTRRAIADAVCDALGWHRHDGRRKDMSARVALLRMASAVLARVVRRLPADWRRAYGYEPVLIETFVQTDRFTGASYRAANWIHVG